MVYLMRIYADGGCRHNGTPKAYGAAAAVVKARNGEVIDSYGEFIPQTPRPTNQRAEMLAFGFALRMAITKNSTLQNIPWLDIKIYSDSRYAVNCMTVWREEWRKNGWITSDGKPVANQDLIRKAHEHDDFLRDFGDVEYCWIPREENREADQLCNKVLDSYHLYEW
jgi:ribonuclease HI